MLTILQIKHATLSLKATGWAIHVLHEAGLLVVQYGPLIIELD